jgi:hypothetical protein
MVPWRVADFSLCDWARFAERISPNSAELGGRAERHLLGSASRRGGLLARRHPFTPEFARALFARNGGDFRIRSVVSENSCKARHHVNRFLGCRFNLGRQTDARFKVVPLDAVYDQPLRKLVESAS